MAEKEITSNEISFNADLCVVRKSQKANSFYLVRNGTKLLTEGAGFDSDSEITIYANGNEGAIITNGATVKIKGKGIENVKFDPVAQLISSGKDFIEVQLSEGTYYFK